MRRRSFIGGLAAIVAAPATAQVRGPGPMRRGPPPPPRTSGDRTTVPLEAGFGLPVVSVSLAGKAFRFGIDTGAMGYGRVTTETARLAGFAEVGHVLMGDPSGRNPRDATVFGAPALVIGDVTFQDLTLEEALMAPPGVAGILGLDLFAGLLVELDRRASVLRLDHGSLPQADALTVFASSPGPALRIPVRIDSRVLDADIDTGQSHAGLLVSASTASELPTAGETRDLGAARTVSQEFRLSARRLTVPVTTGKTQLPITEIAWPAPTEVPNLGWAAFEGLSLTIDQLGRRCRIK